MNRIGVGPSGLSLRTGRERSDPFTGAVFDGIEAVRRAGATNMLDRPRVVQIANALGFYEAVLWIHENPGLYARGVFHGFRAEGDADA